MGTMKVGNIKRKKIYALLFKWLKRLIIDDIIVYVKECLGVEFMDKYDLKVNSDNVGGYFSSEQIDLLSIIQCNNKNHVIP